MAIAAKTNRLEAARTAANSRIVATVESTAPATAGRESEGCALAREPMEAIVAALEKKPENSPASGRPKRAPSNRTRMYPAELIEITSKTIFQINRGLIRC